MCEAIDNVGVNVPLFRQGYFPKLIWKTKSMETHRKRRKDGSSLTAVLLHMWWIRTTVLRHAEQSLKGAFLSAGEAAGAFTTNTDIWTVLGI